MKKNEKIKYPLPAFEVIADAIVGDVTALQMLLKHYDQYINKLSLRKYYDEYGGEQYFLDNELKSCLQIKMIAKTLQFKLKHE